MTSMRRERDPSAPPVCVVWHAAGSPPTATLCNALAKRGIQLTLCQSSSIAVARLLNAARTIDADTVLIFLLVEPRKLDAASEAVEVVQRFAPACRCWMYDEREATPLREILRDDLAAWRGPDSGPDGGAANGGPEVTRSASPEPGPQLKLVPSDPDLPSSYGFYADDAGADDPFIVPEALGAEADPDIPLSEAELGMLLDDDKDPDPPDLPGR